MFLFQLADEIEHPLPDLVPALAVQRGLVFEIFGRIMKAKNVVLSLAGGAVLKLFEPFFHLEIQTQLLGDYLSRSFGP